MYQVLSIYIYQVLSNVPQYEASLINFDNTEVFLSPAKRVHSLKNISFTNTSEVEIEKKFIHEWKKLSPQSVIKMNIDPFISYSFSRNK